MVYNFLSFSLTTYMSEMCQKSLFIHSSPAASTSSNCCERVNDKTLSCQGSTVFYALCTIIIIPYLAGYKFFFRLRPLRTALHILFFSLFSVSFNSFTYALSLPFGDLTSPPLSTDLSFSLEFLYYFCVLIPNLTSYLFWVSQVRTRRCY